MNHHCEGMNNVFRPVLQYYSSDNVWYLESQNLGISTSYLVKFCPYCGLELNSLLTEL